MKLRDRIRELRRVKASEILPNPRNWRTHPDAQRNAMRGILAEVGIADALLVRETPHGLMLIDGHLRAETDPNVKWPVLVLDVTEEEADKLLATVDPIAGMAEVDQEKLAALLEEIDFESDELEKMLADLTAGDAGPAEVTEDDVPAPPAEPIARPGDLWTLGEHRLLCGDSTKAEDVARLMGGVPADLVLTDPPYGIDAVGSDGRIGYAKKFGRIEGDMAPFDPSHLLGLAPVVVLWGANHYADRLPASPSWLVWDKRADNHQNDFADCELAWCNDGAVARVFRHLWSGFVKASERGEDRVHPTQKPIALMSWVLEAKTGPGGVVIDLYAGSGTTIIAAEQLGRRCFACEISPAYTDVCVKRWENLTGEKAKRAKA